MMKPMKQFFSLMICLFFGILLFCQGVYAAETGESELIYDLTVDGKDVLTAAPGSIITVGFTIRSDSEHSVRILQNEIIYDQSFFAYVPGSASVVKGGSNALFQTRTNGTHIIKASYLTPYGSTFSTDELFCTFDLRVIGTSGTGWISCDWDCAKAYDGDNLACTINDGDSDSSADILVTADGPCHTFIDVKNDDWFHSAVDYVTLRGLMNGVGGNAFNPSGTMTRAMLVTVLYRQSGSPAVRGTNPFTDVPDGQWYTDAVIWANENSIITGYGDGRFGTNDSITREQIAVIMHRYAGFLGIDTPIKQIPAYYTDASAVSDWAEDAMAWANAVGLINGRTETTLVPTGTATRAEVAAILMRFCENIS